MSKSVAGRRKGPIRLALERSVRALAVGQEHAVLVETCRMLADAMDWGFDDRVAREFRLSVKALMEATANGGFDAFEQAVEDLRSRASLGDPADVEP